MIQNRKNLDKNRNFVEWGANVNCGNFLPVKAVNSTVLSRDLHVILIFKEIYENFPLILIFKKPDL